MGSMYRTPTSELRDPAHGESSDQRIFQASNSKLRNAVKEKEESDQRLQFIGFAIEQIRKGNYTRKEWESDTSWESFVALVEKSPVSGTRKEWNPLSNVYFFLE